MTMSSCIGYVYVLPCALELADRSVHASQITMHGLYVVGACIIYYLSMYMPYTVKICGDIPASMYSEDITAYCRWPRKHDSG